LILRDILGCRSGHHRAHHLAGVLANGDADTSHGWELIEGLSGTFSYMSMMDSRPAFPGSFAMPLGTPSPRGWPGETVSFTAASAGTNTYVCPVPGHAQKGMHGAFIVT